MLSQLCTPTQHSCRWKPDKHPQVGGHPQLMAMASEGIRAALGVERALAAHPEEA